VDRKVVFTGAIPQDTDLLMTNKFAMVGLGMLALDILGSNTVASGFACTPTSPASLNVQVSPGRLYSLQNVDNNAYGSVAADTAHQILKQGILADAQSIGCAAPGTFGFSINYLIQASYQDQDTDLTVLPYYNASNPSQPFSGLNNNGVAQGTTRAGSIIVNAKPGIAASTGSQTTPSPDAGFVGLYVVTVANGQTTITSANIKTLATAPFISGSFPLILTGPFNAPVTITVNYTKIGKTVTLFFPNTLGVAAAAATNLLTSAAGSIPANLIPADATAAFAVNPIGAFYSAMAAMYIGTGSGTAGFATGEAGRAGIDSVGVFQVTKPSNWSTISGSINGFSSFSMTYRTGS
jgi:hypothetical protein